MLSRSVIKCSKLWLFSEPMFQVKMTSLMLVFWCLVWVFTGYWAASRGSSAWTPPSIGWRLGPETAHQVEQFHLQQGQQQRAGGGPGRALGRVRAQGVPHMQRPDCQDGWGLLQSHDLHCLWLFMKKISHQDYLMISGQCFQTKIVE